MKIDEIIRIVKETVHKSVVLNFGSGEVMAVILTVDDEGFVYDPDPQETRKTNPNVLDSFRRYFRDKARRGVLIVTAVKYAV